MIGKINEKNGFQFTYEKLFFDHWVYFWSLRPIGKQEWVSYSLPQGKTKKANVLEFLDNPSAAEAFYEQRIAEMSDVETAQQELESAKRDFARVSDPEWGGRGNNPDRDSKRIKYAKDRLESTTSHLERAIRLRERLNNPN